jgi:hypothetical protein
MFKVTITHNDQRVSEHVFHHFAGACQHLARRWSGDAYQAVAEAERNGQAERVHESQVVPGARTVYLISFDK